jgi:predicted negative regulator of RcsB-dependent stress response
VAETSKDRNKDIKNKLLKKKEEDAQRRAGLAPGEMVDDALARGMASFIRWLRDHTALMQGGVVVAILAGSGYAYYQHRVEKRAEEVSSALFKGARSDLGKISPNPKTEEEAVQDPTPSWRSTEDRRTAALVSYRKAMTSHPGSGAAILARLGEAGVLFEQNNWDGAITALREVKASPLGKADASVRGRAAELEGLSLEAKGDLDGALKAFREVQNTDLRGLRELGMYEQARILYGRGDAAGAKNLLTSVREKLHPKSDDSASGPSAEQRMLPFLSSQVDDLLRRIDPSSVTTGGRAGGSKMSPADLERMQEQFKRQMKEAQEKAERAKGQTPTEAPAPASSGAP